MKKRSVYFLSDRTGITAEMLGHSILTQFRETKFEQITIPFIDDTSKAVKIAKEINIKGKADKSKPIIFSTLVEPKIAKIIKKTNCVYLDCFNNFITPLEEELSESASHKIGLSHVIENNHYMNRMEAINFTVLCDDGQGTKNLDKADVILIGVSRCGKTPTCLFLAMQYGIKAANYPLIPEDFDNDSLPNSLKIIEDKNKIFGLTIRPERLSSIRQERRPNSKYASIENCTSEVKHAEQLINKSNIFIIDSTQKSVEEVATVILQKSKLTRRIY